MSKANDGPPKLYTTKPKKSQLKQAQHKAKDYSSPPLPPKPMDPPPPPPSSSSTAAATASSGLPPGKESFVRRYKFVLPLLLTVNLAVGAYVFLRTGKKGKKVEESEVAVVPSTPAASTTASVLERPLSAPALIEPVKVREPIPEDKQRELFKWVLEEKRKVKPKDSEEKKRLDEEKAILKQFLKAKSLPSF